jgi:hypothetical protein
MTTPKNRARIKLRLRRGVLWCSVLLLLAGPSLCVGAVYRCNAKDGSTTYSDQPCAADAQVVQAQPAPPVRAISSSSPPTLAPGQARVNETLERIAAQCEASDYNYWYGAQNPKPSPEDRIAKLKEIVQKCRATLPFQKSSSNGSANSTLAASLPQAPPASLTAKPSIRISQIASTAASDATAASTSSLAAKPGSTVQAAAPFTAGAAIPTAPSSIAGKEPTFSELINGPLSNLEAYLSRPGSDVNERKENSETLLDISADRNKTSIVKYLLDHGADIEASPGHGNIYLGVTPLHHAAYMNSIEAAELLISRGAKVDSHQEVNGGHTPTPLCEAASQGNLQMVVMLLNHGADVEAQFGVHQSPLSEALAHGHMNVVQALMDHGAKLKPQYLAAAAMQGRVEATKLLLTQAVDQVTKDGALRYAILGGPEHSAERKQIVQDLLDHGAGIDNLSSVPDVIPVMFATTPDMVEFLFDRGANREAKLSGAQLARAYVCNDKVKDPVGILSVLVSRGIDIRGEPTAGALSAMACAMRSKNSPVEGFLIAHGVAPGTMQQGTSVSAIQNPVSATPIEPCEHDSTPSESKTSKSPTQQEIDDMPRYCQSTNASSGAVIIWMRAHLRGGIFGDNPDPMFGALRSEDGHFAIYSSLLSTTNPDVTVPIDDQWKYMTSAHPQGEAPRSIYALLHRHGTQYRLLPLNFSAELPTRIDLPWRPAGLSSAYDAGQGKYLLYPEVIMFLTPSWSPSIPSWEDFYVWWFDAKHDTIVRQLLPAGAWVTDAKLDVVLGRDLRNFSCGTDCYRHFEIKADSGKIFVTISGRSSAVSEGVMGTYSLDQGGKKWVKIKAGKPE